MILGDKLKALRTAKKMSQKELAERIGIAKSVISFYESGDRFPSYDVLIKIAHIFNVSTDYLLDIERDRKVDVSDLSEDDIAVVTTVIDALKRKTMVRRTLADLWRGFFFTGGLHNDNYQKYAVVKRGYLPHCKLRCCDLPSLLFSAKSKSQP